MKSLYILRHGKSDWHTSVPDHDRPLAQRGERAARFVGQFLSRANQTPDLILSSTALRARSTATLAASSGNWKTVIQETDALYDATATEALFEIAKVSKNVDRLLVLGHEPMCSSLVEKVTGGWVSFVTAALASIEFPIKSWSELSPHREEWHGKLIFFIPPKLFTKNDFPFVKQKK